MSIPVSIDPLGTLGGEPPLPPGYTRVESVLFDSANSTGSFCHMRDIFEYSAGTVVEIDAALAGGIMVAGQLGGEGEGRYANIRWYASGSITVELPTPDTSSVHKYAYRSKARTVIRLDIPAGKAYCDGVLVTECAPNTSFGVCHYFFLGCSGRWPTSGDRSDFRLFGMKVWTDGVLEVWLVPALDPDGAACLYDVVRDKKFVAYSSGSPLKP